MLHGTSGWTTYITGAAQTAGSCELWITGKTYLPYEEGVNAAELILTQKFEENVRRLLIDVK